jgi:hypothetical protein
MEALMAAGSLAGGGVICDKEREQVADMVARMDQGQVRNHGRCY